MNGLVSIWVSGPMAMVTLVVVAAHLIAMRTADMPESRRRIRTANGWLMMVAVPVLVVAFSVVHTGSPRPFALVWGVAIMLLALVLAMAFLDMANNLRLARIQQRQLRREMGARLRQRPANASGENDGN